jgi:hypothetical protein
MVRSGISWRNASTASAAIECQSNAMPVGLQAAAQKQPQRPVVLGDQ